MIEKRIEELVKGDLYDAEELVFKFTASHGLDESLPWIASVIRTAENKLFEVVSVERDGDSFFISSEPFDMLATIGDTVFVLEDGEDANWF